VSEELGDVPGEDGHEEGRHDPTDQGSPRAADRDQGCTEGDFDHSGAKHHGIGVYRHPPGHLRLELLPLPGEVTGPGEHEERTQRDPAHRPAAGLGLGGEGGGHVTPWEKDGSPPL
jgi:hypothetical protein